MRCRCGDRFIHVNHLGHHQGEDTFSKMLGKCEQCRNGTKKQCECGEWHILPGSDCLKCFLLKRKELRKNELIRGDTDAEKDIAEEDHAVRHARDRQKHFRFDGS